MDQKFTARLEREEPRIKSYISKPPRLLFCFGGLKNFTTRATRPSLILAPPNSTFPKLRGFKVVLHILTLELGSKQDTANAAESLHPISQDLV